MDLLGLRPHYMIKTIFILIYVFCFIVYSQDGFFLSPPRWSVDSTDSLYKQRSKKGMRSEESISKTVFNNRSALRDDYLNRLKEKPELEGNIIVQYKIIASGDVISSKVIKATLIDEILQQKVVTRTAKWKYERINVPNDTTEVYFPFYFTKPKQVAASQEKATTASLFEGLGDINKDSSYKKWWNSTYLYEWKIRGNIFSNQNSRIHLIPIQGAFDTVYFHHPGDTFWNRVLCRIPEEAEYETAVNPCCGDLIFRPTISKSHAECNLIFKLTSTDEKIYLGRIGSNGAILKKNVPIQLKTKCAYDESAMSSRYSTISIEEIDTARCSDDCENVELEDGVDINAYPPGKVQDPFKMPDVCMTRQINCFQKGKFKRVTDGFAYCSRKRIISFEFSWLDNSPLIVEFDAKNHFTHLK